MRANLFAKYRKFALGALAACAASFAAPVGAQQIESVDPDLIIDGDLSAGSGGQVPQPANPQTATPPIATTTPATNNGWGDVAEENPSDRYAQPVLDLPPEQPAASDLPAASEPAPAETTTYKQDDLIGEAEGLFGKGAKGLATLIEDILKDQGEPIGYIVGREGGGALVVGVRYGSGTLHHKIEGNMPIYWTGPSIGLDVGASAANTFVLVYNVYDTEELYERFPAGEGQAYFVGGFNASYLRKGNIVLIPIRVGAGLRLGVNAGYMKFSKKQRWLPF